MNLVSFPVFCLTTCLLWFIQTVYIRHKSKRYAFYDGRIHQWVTFPCPIQFSKETQSPQWLGMKECLPYVERYASKVYAIADQCYPDGDKFLRCVRKLIKPKWKQEWEKWLDVSVDPKTVSSSFLKEIGAYYAVYSTLQLRDWLNQQMEVKAWQERCPNTSHPIYGYQDSAYHLYHVRMPKNGASIQLYHTLPANMATLPHQQMLNKFCPTTCPTGVYYDILKQEFIWLVKNSISKKRVRTTWESYLQLFSFPLVSIRIESFPTDDPLLYCMHQTKPTLLLDMSRPSTLVFLSTRLSVLSMKDLLCGIHK